MFDRHLEESVRAAFKLAHCYKHEYVTLEHLLLALLENESALKALRGCGVDVGDLSAELVSYLKEVLPPAKGKGESEPTLAFQRVLQHAVVQGQATKSRPLSGANVIASFFEEPKSHAANLLMRRDIEQPDIIGYINNGAGASGAGAAGEPGEQPDFEADADADDGAREMQRYPEKTPPFLENLNEKAAEGLVDPLIGREDELDRTIRILSRRTKNNPLYIGDAGVGKTAIVEGLAQRIADGDVPETMRDTVIYSLNICGLLAGTRYRGDFEQRMKSMLDWLADRDEAVLFIDEIHTVIGAGSASGSSTDASNLLKPALSSGAIRCIGSTTINEYRAIFEKDNALARRFQKVDVGEPDTQDTYKILLGLRSRFGAFHKVKYPRGALLAAAELSSRYLHDRALPDKAIDVMDEAGAAVRLRAGVSAAGDDKPCNVGVRDIERAVAAIAKVPTRHVSRDDKNVLMTLERDLKAEVFGQDGAIERVVAAVKLARSGLRDERKPVGSFLFAGPTGVGKTELAKQLAECLGTPLLRHDMSEYMERHTVSRLIGAPPGYVGYDRGGLLSNGVLSDPHSVVLLDEIEKAHFDVFNVLLQVMDNAMLTDGNGRKVDFSNVILIMTSNVGAAEMEKHGLGFVPQTVGDRGESELKRVFSPEFRNRLDATIMFNPLDAKVVGAVVDKCIDRARARLKTKGVELEVGAPVKRWFAEHGYDEKMGVRMMQRLVDERLVRPLLDAVLFGDLTKGGRVRFSMKSGEPVFVCKSPADA